MIIEFKLPELGENIASGDIVNILVREGEEIAANQGVVELETEKAVVEIPCPHAGKVIKIQVKKGDTVKVGQVVLTLEAEAESPPEKPPAGSRPSPRAATKMPARTATKLALTPGPSPGAGRRIVPAGPAVRRLARELGVDLGRVHGSGPHGRITVEDVRAAGVPHRPLAAPGTCGFRRRPSRPGEPGRTPGARSAASGCRGFAAPSPSRWPARPPPSPT